MLCFGYVLVNGSGDVGLEGLPLFIQREAVRLLAWNWQAGLVGGLKVLVVSLFCLFGGVGGWL